MASAGSAAAAAADDVAVRMRGDVGFFYAVDRVIAKVVIDRHGRSSSVKQGHCTECGIDSNTLLELPVDHLCIKCACAAGFHYCDWPTFSFTTTPSARYHYHDDVPRRDKNVRRCRHCQKCWSREDITLLSKTTSLISLAFARDTAPESVAPPDATERFRSTQ